MSSKRKVGKAGGGGGWWGKGLTLAILGAEPQNLLISGHSMSVSGQRIESSIHVVYTEPHVCN